MSISLIGFLNANCVMYFPLARISTMFIWWAKDIWKNSISTRRITRILILVNWFNDFLSCQINLIIFVINLFKQTKNISQFLIVPNRIRLPRQIRLYQLKKLNAMLAILYWLPNYSLKFTWRVRSTLKKCPPSQFLQHRSIKKMVNIFFNLFFIA